MDKYSILLSYFEKQTKTAKRFYPEIISLDITNYENQFVFATRVQQFYTAIEDLFKQIAKAFENHIEEISRYHKELLIRMTMEIPKIRPALLSSESFVFLDHVRSFRHFVRHAYDCEFDAKRLKDIQLLFKKDFKAFEKDLETFRSYIKKLAT